MSESKKGQGTEGTSGRDGHEEGAALQREREQLLSKDYEMEAISIMWIQRKHRLIADDIHTSSYHFAKNW